MVTKTAKLLQPAFANQRLPLFLFFFHSADRRKHYQVCSFLVGSLGFRMSFFRFFP